MPMLASCQCWPHANAGLMPMLALRQCWLCANAGFAPMLASRQCWLRANAGFAPMLASGQCWLRANAGFTPMLASCRFVNIFETKIFVCSFPFFWLLLLRTMSDHHGITQQIVGARRGRSLCGYKMKIINIANKKESGSKTLGC